METTQSMNFVPRQTVISAAWLNWVDDNLSSGQYAPISVTPGNEDHYTQLTNLVAQVAALANAMVVPGRMTIDGGGHTYNLTDTWQIEGVEHLKIKNFNFKPSGAGWSASKFLVKTKVSANGVEVDQCFFECDRQSSGLQVDSPKAIISRVEVVRWKTTGSGIYLSDGGNGVRLFQCDTHQWEPSDAEQSDEANWLGQGIYIDSHDVKVIDCRSYWSGIPFRIGSNGNACEVGGKSHFYNGDSSVIPLDKTVVQVDAGGGCKFNDCYIGNGIIKLYATGCHFNGTRVQYDLDSNATMTPGRAFIEVYADGKAGPRNMLTSNWMASSADLKNGSVPFIKFLPNGADSWSGDWDYINDLAGPKNINGRMVFVNPRDEDDDYSAIAFLSPSTDPGSFPTKLVLGDGTSTALLSDLGGIASFGNYVQLFSNIRRVRNITGSAGTTTLVGNDTGKSVVVDTAAAAHTIRLDNENPKGWQATVTRIGANNVTLSLKAGATGAGKGITFPLTMASDYDSVTIMCYENSTGTAAKYVVAWGV